tara:strand:- start:91 stop:720 length:630 start_codon:yes stop_codon:yes gene_type:complete
MVQFLPSDFQAWILDPNFTTKSNIWSYMENVFSHEECDKIIEYGSVKYRDLCTEGRVAGIDPEGEKNIKKRSSEVVMIPNHDEEVHWLFQKLCRAVNAINEQVYEYDLRAIETLQYTTYDSSYNGFYTKHIDSRYGIMSRKLSLTVQLSDPDDYEGGDVLLHLGSEPHVANKLRGSITFFPSFVLHEVTPVTKGRRNSLVLWVVGPEFK